MSDQFDQDQLDELVKCKNDFVYFCEKYVKIVHPKKGLIPFQVYDYQKRLIKDYEDHRFVIGKKFRQGGFTTLTIIWLLWKCLFFCDIRVLAISKTDREACHVGRIVEKVIDYLPDWMKPEMGRCNDHEKTFPQTGSSMCFYPPVAARSKAADYLLVDEAAFIQNMDEHWKAMYPVVSCGGHVIALSSVNGTCNWFADTWFGSIGGENAFVAFEADYREHPDYNNQAWVDEMRKNLGELGWMQEVLCQFVDRNRTVVEEIASEDAKNMSNFHLAQRLKTAAYRFKKSQDVELKSALIEAWKRLAYDYKNLKM